jgi:hypothetical protein
MERATDGQLAALIAAVLFAIAAWPLALVDYPPLQDLPNHLAAVTVILHPSEYPEFVYNGLLKTNSALFAWLLVVGGLAGLRFAAKSFVLVVLALGAIAYPRFVLAFGGRRRMVLSAFFAWPMVHDWFVSAGMLDFALAVPLSALLLVALKAQRDGPTVLRGIAIALLAVLIWTAHVFPLLVVHLLVAIEILRGRSWSEWSELWRRARALVPPLLPASALVAWSVLLQATEPVGAMTGYVALGKLLPLWESFYNLWAEWLWGFTKLEIATIVPCVALGLWAMRRWRDDVPFFGPIPFLVLGALYFFTPYVASNWFHVSSRFIPYLWLAALVRLPEQLPRAPRAVLGVLGACAVSYSVGMGIDYVRLDRARARFTAGIAAVPHGATLLPLVFRSKATSENTRALLHAWGYYVVEKHTSAPLLFAHSRSFPVMYREPPSDPQLNHLVLESFAPSMKSPDGMCSALRSVGVALHDCEGEWRERWAELWSAAEPRYGHVLLWEAPPAVMALVPPEYHVVFRQDELTVLARLAREQ